MRRNEVCIPEQLMRTAFVLGIAAMGISAILPWALPLQPTATPSEEVMWRKLDLAHDSLDALALDDFEALAAYADDFEALAQAGKWLESESPAYRTESEQFRRAAEALGKAASKRDSGAAVLAYVDLTLRCIRCHRTLGVRPPR